MDVEVFFLTFPFYYLVAIYAKTGRLFCENEEKEKEVREQFKKQTNIREPMTGYLCLEAQLSLK